MSEFNRDKCQQRNRFAARRDHVEASPFVLLAAVPATQADGLRYAHGTLPATPEAALARINELLPPGAPPLTLEQIHIHYAEAANNRYIGERDARPMFLGDSTLRNIAQDATVGVAFMNSHRAGGLSHPAELPMGRTFAGRFEQQTDGQARALVGFYMVRGTAPNGAQGPTTDDLHAGIQAGTVFDVSVGLGGGEQVCDVCGEALDATREEEDANGYKRRVRLCVHIPGTTHKMTKDEQAAQRARGVSKGTATYTLHNAHCGEVSAVYDGAVPGAGFTKLLALARDLSPAERAQARVAYATLLRTGDLPMDELTDLIEQGVGRALRGFRGRGVPPPEEAEMVLLTPGVSASHEADPQMTALQAELAAERQKREAHEARLAQVEADRRAEQATTFADQLVTSGHILPAVRPLVLAAYRQALADDATHGGQVAFSTALGQAQQGTRAALLTALFESQPAHTLTAERVPEGSTRLPAAPGGGRPHQATYDGAVTYAKQANRQHKEG